MSKSGLNQSLNDRTAFWGVKVTPELKYLQQVLNGKVSQITVSRTCFADLLKSKEFFFKPTYFKLNNRYIPKF